MLKKYQFLPSLSLDEYEALRESIKENGVIEPVITDEDGNILDGHHRVKACSELGIEYPTRVIEGKSSEEKINLSFDLNIPRRHLTPEQKKELAKQYLEEGWKQEDIAKRLRITPGRVSQIVKEFSTKLFNQFSPMPPKPDPTVELRKQVEYYERLAKQQEQEVERLNAETERRIAEERKRHEAQLKEARAAAVPAPVDPSTIEKRANELAAEKIEEMQRRQFKRDEEYQKRKEALEAQYQAQRQSLETRIAEKMKEIGEAEKVHLDVTKLEGEKQGLIFELAGLRAERDVQLEDSKTRDRLRKLESAIVPIGEIAAIVEAKLSNSPDVCGMSMDELEYFQRAMERVSERATDLAYLIAGQVGRIREGGGLRVVQGGTR